MTLTQKKNEPDMENSKIVLITHGNLKTIGGRGDNKGWSNSTQRQPTKEPTQTSSLPA